MVVNVEVETSVKGDAVLKKSRIRFECSRLNTRCVSS